MKQSTQCLGSVVPLAMFKVFFAVLRSKTRASINLRLVHLVFAIRVALKLYSSIMFSQGHPNLSRLTYSYSYSIHCQNRYHQRWRYHRAINCLHCLHYLHCLQCLGKPLFEMSCFHMGIACKEGGGGGGVQADHDGLEHFFPPFGF